MKYFLTVKIAEVGTPHGSGKSLAGHVWFELSQLDDNGNPVLFNKGKDEWRPFISSGFAPEQEGSPRGVGKVFDTDTDEYGYANQSVKVEITEKQFNDLRQFHDTQSANGITFDRSNYNVINHNCVTYVGTALRVAGLNQKNEILSADGSIPGNPNYMDRYLEAPWLDPEGIMVGSAATVDIISGAPGFVKDDFLRILKENNANITHITEGVAIRSRGSSLIDYQGYDASFIQKDAKTGQIISFSFKDPNKYSEVEIDRFNLMGVVGSSGAQNTFKISNPRSVVLKDLHAQGLDIPFSTSSMSVVINKDRINADAKRGEYVANTFYATTGSVLTGDFRPANHNMAEEPIHEIMKKVLPYTTAANRNAYGINGLVGWANRVQPTDPLVLDLNDDGVKLTRYTEKKVLFDIDNDGGSREETGWVGADDGILVRDLNGNGKIDNISETFSEYYAGKVGINGESGEKLSSDYPVSRNLHPCITFSPFVESSRGNAILTT